MKTYSAITVDVEDGINIAMRDHFNISRPPTERVKKNTDELLDLFSKYNIKATFFVLGEVAERYPDLIKRIENVGHEIGVHGYSHHQFSKFTAEEASDDIARAKRVIENIIEKPVKGFRAPAFSIMPETSWALSILTGLGFKYDSSIMPAQVDRYGWLGFPNEIKKINMEDGSSLVEVPLSTVKLFGRSIPVCGGGYLRLFPYWFTRWSFSQIQKEKPAIIYMHPYEIDTKKYPEFYLNELKKASLKKKMRMHSYWFNRKTVKNKLESLIKEFTFVPLEEVIDINSQLNEIGTILFQDIC